MRHNTFRLALAAIVMAGASLSGQGGQPPAAPAPPQPSVTFRAEVNYVEVDARVVDAQGKFVTGLTADDFEVLEDGKPQAISVFAPVDIPVERQPRPLFANRSIERDVLTNQSAYNGRVYLLVLDDLHTTPLLATRTRHAARQFVERYVGANDVAAVVHTSGRADAAQEFTSNQRLLLAAIDKFSGRKLRSSLLNRLDEEQRTRDTRARGDRIDDIDAAERGYQARTALETLRDVTTVIENVRGRRKALVYFSEGIDYDITDVFNNRDASTVIDTTRDVIAAATRANVAIYGVDVRGLGAGADTGIEIQSYAEDPTLGLGPSALINEVRLGQDSLRTLSEETGGFAVVNSNDLASAFERLVEENSSYYVLGYYPANERRDGRFRKIEVRVKRPGLTVRARRGYVAPRGRAQETRLAGPNDASNELREAMSSPVPVSGLPLASTASVFKGPDGKGAVVISTLIGGRDLSLVEKDGAFHNDLEVAWMAVDGKGKVFPGDRNTVNLTLKPETLSRVRAAGFRVISSLELPPGRYQLRIAVREGNTKRSGSILLDVEVPEFAKAPLSMSGLALTSAASSIAPSVRPKDPLAKLLPGPLTTTREFTQNDEVAIFTEVYESGGGPPHKVEIRLQLLAEGGQAVFQTREERDSSELAGSSGGYGFSTRLPLADIPPGRYVLRVEAQSQVGERATVHRETLIAVVPRVGPAPTPPPSAPAAPAAAAPAPAPATPPPAAGTPGTAPAAPAATPVQFAPLNADLMSGIDRAEQVVARTPTEWQALWQRHAPGRPSPDVDWATRMAVGVFLGTRPSGGYGVEITGIRREGETMIVEWAERQPAPGQMATQVLTAPAHLVSVPRHAGEVRFVQVGR